MEPNELNEMAMKLLAAKKLLDEVRITGMEDMVRVVSVMKELERMAGELQTIAKQQKKEGE